MTHRPPVSEPSIVRKIHLTDVHGVQLGQQDFRQVHGLRVMVLYAFSLLPIQSLWVERGLCIKPRTFPMQPAATKQRTHGCYIITET